jgi:ABC-type nitrate/sulfonate/bicarbonate transport system substrate-binding protein
MSEVIFLTAGYATIGQGAGPMIVTERAGFFARHGLEVKSILLKGATGVVRALMSGEIQFGNLAAPALLRAVLLEEADLVYLTGGINQQFLMGRPGIVDRRQLSDGKIGFAGDRGLNDLLVNFILDQLAREGITNVQKASGSVSAKDRIAALMEGRSDAEIITPPHAVIAKRQGCSFLVDFAEYGLNFALGGIAARRAYISENYETARKFIRAYVEGMHRYRTDRDFTVHVQQEYSGITDRTVAEETFDITSPGMPKAPYPVVEALGQALRFMSGEIPQAATADPFLFADDRFIRELDEEGFISRLYIPATGCP